MSKVGIVTEIENTMKKVYGIGYNDLKETEGQSKFYKTWQNMLKRCYSEVGQIERPSYIGCIVCEDWLTFSNFKAWMEAQDWEGKQLDKDLLVSGNKVYSSETCVFIERSLNLFMTEKKSNKTEYPVGVDFHKGKKKFRSLCTINGVSKHLGYFNSAEEAHEAWRIKKLEIAKSYASEQSDKRIAKAIVERYQI